MTLRSYVTLTATFEATDIRALALSFPLTFVNFLGGFSNCIRVRCRILTENLLCVDVVSHHVFNIVVPRQ